MSRKTFIESHGATTRNWRYAWAFVNHEEKEVIFGAWDTLTNPDKSLILAMDWEYNEKGNKQNAFKEALEYAQLAVYEGYKLKTFPIIEDTEHFDENGSSKIKEHIEELTDMEMQVINGDYYAVGHHKPQHSSKELDSEAADIQDIFDSEVSQTEKQQLVMSRIGQGRFRKNVIDVWGNDEKCALTLVSTREVLIASHIIPWSKCDSNEQRLDGANGILLCAHIDKLFDRHKLTFVKQGFRYITKLSPELDSRELSYLGIESGQELSTSLMSSKFQQRFDHYIQQHNHQFLQLNKK